MLRGELMPSRRALMIVILAMGLMVLATACAVMYLIAGAGQAEQPGAAALGIGLLMLPFVVVALLLAALLEKHPAPRAAIWLLLTLTVGASSVIFALAMALDPTAGPQVGLATLLACGGPLTLLLFLPALFSALKAGPQIKERLRSERERRLVERVGGQGVVVLADLAAELALNETDAAALVEALASQERLAATVYRAQGLVYSDTTLYARWNKLLSVVYARGKIGLRDLAIELGASEELTKEWLYELVHLGRFSGYINWRESTLYSAEAQAQRQEGRCPQCGGELELVGKGTVRCGFCGAEVFL
jgi:hypothetical protein